jgi:tRNA 2-thiocytidine biosynthesis protein TtcA
VKELLRQWEKKTPGRLDNMFRALQNVVPSHLADTKLFDFQGLQPQDAPFDNGDLVFDHD